MKLREYKLFSNSVLPLKFGDIVLVPTKVIGDTTDKRVWDGKEIRPVFVVSATNSRVVCLCITSKDYVKDWYATVKLDATKTKGYIVCDRVSVIDRIYDFPIWDDSTDDWKRDKNGNVILKHFIANVCDCASGENILIVKSKFKSRNIDIDSLGKKDESLKESLNESLQESYELEEEIKVNNTLNKDLFDDNDELKEEVNEKLLDIVDSFLDKLNEDKIKINIVDVRLLGSNANYNYTDKSDIDLHIVADIDSLPCEQHVMNQLYDAYKSNYNKKHDIKIKGHDVEIYVEDVKTPANSNGVYSLYTGWIKKPDKTKIPEIDYEEFEKVFKEYEDRYWELMKDSDYYKTSEKESDTLKESNSNIRHLSDVVKKIDLFKVFADIDDAHYDIFDESLCEDIEDDEQLFYLGWSDEQLKELAKEDTKDFTNFELLDRLYKLNKELLSKEQLELLKNNFRQKIVIDREDVEDLLNKFKSCDNIWIEPYKKNRKFMQENNLTENDCLAIVHNLKISDYYANTKSINDNYLGNNIMIFEPKNVVKNDGTKLGDFTVYVKLDIDEMTNDTIALISIHKALEQNKLPYRESIKCIEESSSFRNTLGVIKAIYVYDNIDDFHFRDENYFVEDIDGDDELTDESDMLDWPDDLLLDLNKEEISKLRNIELLDKLCGLDKSKLSREQIKLLQKEYRKSLPATRDVIDDIINSFKQCYRIYLASRDKNNDFIEKHDLSNDECLEIVHNLKYEDFYKKTRSINYGHLGDNLIVFKPKNVKLSNGKELGNIVLYIKIDLDESSNSSIVAVSFHQDDCQNNLNETLLVEDSLSNISSMILRSLPRGCTYYIDNDKKFIIINTPLNNVFCIPIEELTRYSTNDTKKLRYPGGGNIIGNNVVMPDGNTYKLYIGKPIKHTHLDYDNNVKVYQLVRGVQSGNPIVFSKFISDINSGSI